MSHAHAHSCAFFFRIECAYGSNSEYVSTLMLLHFYPFLRIECEYELEGSLQHCVKSDIDVRRKEALNVFKLVIYKRIGKWPKDEIIVIALFS